MRRLILVSLMLLLGTRVGLAEPTPEASVSPTPGLEQEINESAQSLSPSAEAQLPVDATALSSTTQVDTPTSEPEGPKAAPKILDAPDVPKFHWSRFLLGGLGGSALGVGIGAFAASRSDGSYDPDKGATLIPLAAVGGFLIGGGLSVLLGLTTPVPPQPPKLHTFAPRNTPNIAWNLDF